MKEHPILFNAEMVRAILEGRKTQTRRPVTVPWKRGKRVPPYEPYYVEEDGHLFFEDEYGDFHQMEQRCPYAQPGDVLWVREAWRTDFTLDGFKPRDLTPNQPDICPILYEADGDATGIVCFEWGKLRPSMHMPRWAARIFLRVKSVRIQRVQDICNSDAQHEGFPNPSELRLACGHPKIWFRENWNSIYGTWDANPWVWVFEFERIENYKPEASK